MPDPIQISLDVIFTPGTAATQDHVLITCRGQHVLSSYARDLKPDVRDLVGESMLVQAESLTKNGAALKHPSTVVAE